MNNVDHIGIAVKSIDKSIQYYIETLGLKLMAIEEVVSQNVRVAFIDAGNIKLELLEPLSIEGPIAKFLENRGEGVHHIEFVGTDIRTRMAELEEKGVHLYQDAPNRGTGGAAVAM